MRSVILIVYKNEGFTEGITEGTTKSDSAVCKSSTESEVGKDSAKHTTSEDCAID